MINSNANQPIGIYLHIPYCLKKCPYCDFNSYAINSDVGKMDEARYVDSLIAELLHYSKQQVWSGRKCCSIFFGGGTPSLFSPNSIEQILKAISRQFSILDDVEVTLEANPGTIHETLGLKKLKDFRQVGINRISMGVQSFTSDKLKRLGRIHSGKDARAAAINIVAAGFNNFNLDLIFAVPGETNEIWQYDLETAISLEPLHISAYGLTLEPGTEFYRNYKKGVFKLPVEDVQTDMYIFTQEHLEKAGYQQYEISNYAKPSYFCKHNLGYWNRRDYLGLGAGAHSFLKQDSAQKAVRSFGTRWSNLPGPAHYISKALAQGDASQLRETIDENKAELEFFFLGLRTTQGISTTEYQLSFGRSLNHYYQDIIQRLKDQELLIESDTYLSLSKKGILLTDSVLNEFAKGQETLHR